MAKRKYIDTEKLLRIAGETLSGAVLLLFVAAVDWVLHEILGLAGHHGFDGFAFRAVTFALDAVLVIDLGWLLIYIAVLGLNVLKENPKNEDAGH